MKDIRSQIHAKPWDNAYFDIQSILISAYNQVYLQVRDQIYYEVHDQVYGQAIGLVRNKVQ